MSNSQDYNSKKDSVAKKLFLFIVATIVIMGILIFALPDSITFLKYNFEFIILGIVIIIGSLVIFSMLNLKFPENENNFVSVRKIVTIEGYDNSYKLI